MFVRKFGQSLSYRKYAQGPNVLYLEFPARGRSRSAIVIASVDCQHGR